MGSTDGYPRVLHEYSRSTASFCSTVSLSPSTCIIDDSSSTSTCLRDDRAAQTSTRVPPSVLCPTALTV